MWEPQTSHPGRFCWNVRLGHVWRSPLWRSLVGSHFRPCWSISSMCNQPGTKICSHRCAKTRDIGTFWISHASSTIWCSSVVIRSCWWKLFLPKGGWFWKNVLSRTHCIAVASAYQVRHVLPHWVWRFQPAWKYSFQFLPHCNLFRVNIFFFSKHMEISGVLWCV